MSTFDMPMLTSCMQRENSKLRKRGNADICFLDVDIGKDVVFLEFTKTAPQSINVEVRFFGFFLDCDAFKKKIQFFQRQLLLLFLATQIGKIGQRANTVGCLLLLVQCEGGHFSH